MRGRRDLNGSASALCHAPTSSVWWFSASLWTSMRQYLLRFFSSSRQMAADAYSSMASLTRTLCCTFGFLSYWSYSSDGRPIKVANSFVASVSGSNMVWPILLVSLPSHAATGGFEGEGGRSGPCDSHIRLLSRSRAVCFCRLMPFPFNCRPVPVLAACRRQPGGAPCFGCRVLKASALPVTPC